VIPREKFLKYRTQAPAENKGAIFDMQGYLAKHGFELQSRKPWNSHPGSEIFELTRCPFDANHAGGSAAFTVADGAPGFACHHNGCHDKTITDVFRRWPPEQRNGRQATTLPVIVVRAGEIPEAVDQAEDILLTSAEEIGIFQRGTTSCASFACRSCARTAC